MAITIKRTPQDFHPAFNRLMWVVDSTNNGQTNMQYICDVYVNGGGTKVIRLKIFPDADGYGNFDLSHVLRDYLAANLNSPTFTGFNLIRDHYVNYILKFGEEYGNTVYADLSTTSILASTMMALSHNEFQSYNYEDYLIGDVNKLYLTNSPRTLKARRGGYGELSFIAYDANEAYSLRIRTYLPDGSLIDTYEIDNPYPSPTSEQYLLSVGVGVYNLNNATLSTGVQPVIDDDCASYDVCLLNLASGQTSEIITFEIDETCHRYDGKHVKWLNRLGGWDTFFFAANEQTFYDISNRQEYTKLVGSNSGSPLTWGYNLEDRGRTVFSVDAQERTSLKSEALTEDEFVWLKELFTSPEVYVIETYGATVYNRPVVITNGSYETVYKRNKKMQTITLDYQYAHKENIQSL